MKSYIAEVFGTFCLVFIGCASVVTGGFGGILPAGAVGIGLSFGIVVIAMAYAIGPVSGAHLNPAVSLGAFLAGRLPAKDLVPYVIAQVIGGILGAVGLYLIVSGKAQPYDFAAAGFAQNGWDPVNGYSTYSAFVTELLATFVFVTVILGVTSEKHTTAFAGLVIGLTLAALHFAFIPVSGNSLNPARSIGPRCSRAERRLANSGSISRLHWSAAPSPESWPRRAFSRRTDLTISCAKKSGGVVHTPPFFVVPEPSSRSERQAAPG